jgi:hypothetical protein
MQASNLNASTQREMLSQAQHLVCNILTDAAKDPYQLMQTMRQAFGSSLDKHQVEMLIEQWSEGKFGALPAVEVLSQKVMGTAQGAYAASTDTIYLSKGLLRHAGRTDDLTGVVGVLLEETGHSIDALLNRSDTVGDEGELFSALIRGQDLSPMALQVLKAEDDSATLNLGGQQVAVEMSQIQWQSSTAAFFKFIVVAMKECTCDRP